jgi:methionyl-tRNA synthetase
VSLGEAIERHGPDALRFFLLREVGFEADGNFTWERFDERYTADLADGLGNLASRSLAMIGKYRDGVVPVASDTTPLDEAGRQAIDAYARAMDALDLRGGAEAAWDLVSTANLHIQQTAPWNLAKQDKTTELDAVLGALARTLYRLSVLASPFLPSKAQELWEALGVAGTASTAAWSSLKMPPIAGVTVRKPAILFPKPAVV